MVFWRRHLLLTHRVKKGVLRPRLTPFRYFAISALWWCWGWAKKKPPPIDHANAQKRRCFSHNSFAIISAKSAIRTDFIGTLKTNPCLPESVRRRAAIRPKMRPLCILKCIGPLRRFSIFPFVRLLFFLFVRFAIYPFIRLFTCSFESFSSVYIKWLFGMSRSCFLFSCQLASIGVFSRNCYGPTNRRVDKPSVKEMRGGLKKWTQPTKERNGNSLSYDLAVGLLPPSITMSGSPSIKQIDTKKEPTRKIRISLPFFIPSGYF